VNKFCAKFSMVINKKLPLHFLVLLVVGALICVWRVVTGRWVVGLSLVWWWMGLFVGFSFVFSDRLIQGLVEEEGYGASLVRAIRSNGWLATIKKIVTERGGNKRLVMRSVLFVIVWLLLGFWTVITAGGAFGRGLILGIGVHVFFDLWWDFLFKKDRVEEWFWQIKRTVTNQEMQGFVYGTGLLGLMVILGL